jgi:hypothetical protein
MGPPTLAPTGPIASKERCKPGGSSSICWLTAPCCGGSAYRPPLCPRKPTRRPHVLPATSRRLRIDAFDKTPRLPSSRAIVGAPWQTQAAQCSMGVTPLSSLLLYGRNAPMLAVDFFEQELHRVHDNLRAFFESIQTSDTFHPLDRFKNRLCRAEVKRNLNRSKMRATHVA